MIIKSFIAQCDSFNNSLRKISCKNVITFKYYLENVNLVHLGLYYKEKLILHKKIEYKTDV